MLREDERLMKNALEGLILICLIAAAIAFGVGMGLEFGGLVAWQVCDWLF